MNYRLAGAFSTIRAAYSQYPMNVERIISFENIISKRPYADRTVQSYARTDFIEIGVLHWYSTSEQHNIDTDYPLLLFPYTGLGLGWHLRISPMKKKTRFFFTSTSINSASIEIHIDAVTCHTGLGNKKESLTASCSMNGKYSSALFCTTLSSIPLMKARHIHSDYFN